MLEQYLSHTGLGQGPGPVPGPVPGPDVDSIGCGRGRNLERPWTHLDPALALTGPDWSQFGPRAWTQLDATYTRLRLQLVASNHCLRT